MEANVTKRLEHSELFGEAKNLLTRYRWRALLVSAGVALMVLVTALFLPRKYEAEAIFERRTGLVLDEISSRGSVMRSLQSIRGTVNASLTGGPAVGRVVDELDLPGTDSNEAAPGSGDELARRELVQHLRRRLRVDVDLASRNQERIRLTLVDSDPDRARTVVNELVRNYIAEVEQRIDKSLDEAAEFFESQRKKHEQRIDDLEVERVQFELKHADLLPGDSAGFVQRIAETEQQLLEAQQAHAAAERRLETLEAEYERQRGESGTITDVVTRPNPEIDEVKARIDQYRKELEQAVTIRQMTEKHPLVIRLRRKIDELEARKKELPAEVVAERVTKQSEVSEALRTKVAEARSEVRSTESAVAMSRDLLTTLNAANAEVFPVRADYRRLERQIREAQREVDFWDENHRRVRVAQAAEGGQRGVTLDFIKPCGTLRVPSSPDLAQVLFAAVAAAAVAGVLTVLISDRTDQSYTSISEVATDTSLPTFGAIGEIITRRRARMRSFVRGFVYPAATVGMLALLMFAGYANYVSLRTPNGGEPLWERISGKLFAPVVREAAAGRDSKLVSVDHDADATH
jgi:uncharacterized protein involved in exopolysaccharide biosynthesis